MTSKVLKINLYDFKFHLLSIIYVMFATIYFLIFKEMLFARIIGIIITIIYFLIKIKREINSI